MLALLQGLVVLLDVGCALGVFVLLAKPDVAAAVLAWGYRPGRWQQAEPLDPERVALLRTAVRRLRLPCVLGLAALYFQVRVPEWIDPLMAGGNWMPELVAAAGGRNMLGAAGKPSGVMQWDEVVAADPEVVVIAPCGYGLERTKAELPVLTARPGWEALAAARDGRVYCADGNAFFNRPGPRLAETVEMLAEMLHPAATGRRHEGAAFVRML